jgi:hypothetical protein
VAERLAWHLGDRGVHLGIAGPSREGSGQEQQQRSRRDLDEQAAVDRGDEAAVSQGGEEHGSEHGDADRTGELLGCLEEARGGPHLGVGDAREDEVEEGRDEHADARTDQ